MTEPITFTWKEACCAIRSPAPDVVKETIVRVRADLDAYILRAPSFRTAFTPVRLLPGAPEIVRRMHEASLRTGVGPMAAVAGCTAQMAVEAALAAGADETVVNNGGDVYLQVVQRQHVGIFPGANHRLCGALAFAVGPEHTPLALCASSGRMGHSASLGCCDLAVVAAADGALADAAATLAANLVRTPRDVDAALERVAHIPAVRGVLIIQEDRVGLAGHLPPLVRQPASSFQTGIVRHPDSIE